MLRVWTGLTVAVFLTSAGSAADALWEGTWTPSPERRCDIPDGDGSPLVVASSAPKPGLYWQTSEEGGEESPQGELGQIEFLREADPYVCYITKVTNIVALPGWIFDTQCGGEGEIWDTRHVLLSVADGDQLGLYDGSTLETLYRCSASVAE